MAYQVEGEREKRGGEMEARRRKSIIFIFSFHLISKVTQWAFSKARFYT